MVFYGILGHLHEESAVNDGHHPRKHLTSKFYAGVWAAWLFTGTMFYGFAPKFDLGIVKGFYMAINVGYSVGWGYPAEGYAAYLWFSSCYVIFGSSLVALALGFFADKIIEDADNWFTNMIQRQEYEKNVAPDQPLFKRIWAFLGFHREAVRALVVWLIWISLMILYSMINIGWSFSEAQYFAISTLSTGGLYALPNDSPTFMFGVTAIFTALGVPVMAVAMASVATMFIDQGNLDGVKDTIMAEVTMEELEMLYKFGFEDGDGQIDRAEYIILCMVRMGTDPRAIEFVSEYFKKMDEDQSGYLSLHEITKGKIQNMDHLTRPETIKEDDEKEDSTENETSSDENISPPEQENPEMEC